MKYKICIPFVGSQAPADGGPCAPHALHPLHSLLLRCCVDQICILFSSLIFRNNLFCQIASSHERQCCGKRDTSFCQQFNIILKMILKFCDHIIILLTHLHINSIQNCLSTWSRPLPPPNYKRNLNLSKFYLISLVGIQIFKVAPRSMQCN